MLIRLLRTPFRLIFHYWLVFGVVGALTVLDGAIDNGASLQQALTDTSPAAFIQGFLYAPINGLLVLASSVFGSGPQTANEMAILFVSIGFLVTAFVGSVFNSAFLVVTAPLIPVIYTLYNLKAWLWIAA